MSQQTSPNPTTDADTDRARWLHVADRVIEEPPPVDEQPATTLEGRGHVLAADRIVRAMLDQERHHLFRAHVALTRALEWVARLAEVHAERDDYAARLKDTAASWARVAAERDGYRSELGRLRDHMRVQARVVQEYAAARDAARATIQRMSAAAFVADAKDDTDWQRGYQACATRVLDALDPASARVWPDAPHLRNPGEIRYGDVTDDG
jgi:hypothetical protein